MMNSIQLKYRNIQLIIKVIHKYSSLELVKTVIKV